MPLRAFFLRVWTRLDVTIGAPGPWSAVEGWVLHPKLYDSPITAARARLMLGCCMIMGLAAPLTFYWAWHAPANATSYLIVGLVQLLTCSTFLLLRWNSTMGLPSTAVMVSTTALVLAATSLTGGLQSVWVLGYPMVTIFVGLLGGYRKTIAAALILSCGATIIYAVDSLGLADLGAPPPPSLMLLNLIGAVIIGVVMAVYATYQSDLLLERAGAALERTRLAQEEAERANRAQEMFMAYLSHEIGNPLAVIMGAVDLMGLPGTEDRQQRYIDAMKSASQGLSGLLKDVLDFRALARGRLQVRKDVVALAELLQEMVDLHSLAADEKELQFHFDHGSETNVWADWSRLRQVMSNLLDNAVKYTSSGFVRVTMETQGDRVRVAVTDSGPGIDPKNREQIFQPFERAQAGDDPGSGLGLAVSRGLVRLMGSELLFEAPEAEVEEACAIIRRVMESPWPLSVPLVVDIGVGGSWAAAH